MKIREIFEARRNPHLNPKVDALDAFSMYANKPNMFVTYTNEFKVGINPNTRFDTPVGIYSYPLDYVLKKAYSKGSVFGAAPFASTAKYVHLFQQTSRNIFDLTHYGRSQYELDKKKLVNYFSQKGMDVEQKIYNIEVRHNDVGGMTYARRMWYMVYDLVGIYTTGKVSIETTRVFYRVLGYDAVYDLDGKGIIHSNEPTQAVHFDLKTIRVVETFSNKEISVDRAEARAEMLDINGMKSEFMNILNFGKQDNMFDAVLDISVGDGNTGSFMISYRNYVTFLDKLYLTIEKREYDIGHLSQENRVNVISGVYQFLRRQTEALKTVLKGNLALRWHESFQDGVAEIIQDGVSEDIVDSLGIAVAGLKRPESQKRVMDTITSLIDNRR